jgi:hypothetical protein
MEFEKLSYLAGYASALESINRSYKQSGYFDIAMSNEMSKLEQYKKILMDGC